ncbi:Retrovirus-related Pol polyprotein from type-1 retrotransposable element R2 [Eumeta japonica]|uniref:Retrovirus-related Pol polyprotein from type-1 retrotransposable element R2 n=1 Tax=Eumeta variegata TaxID=151549 RepID=A0A4C1ZKG7_EUMVA|nr:Retrovirus-related Pol polyprotein from type-1 retrotransposable element R2 [Eumeta japonica]
MGWLKATWSRRYIHIDVIKGIYKNNKGKIKLETFGPSFAIERGVRQGNPLSPKLFIAILEDIISKIDWSKSGLYINGEYLSHLRFADDLVLLSECSTQLQQMMETLHLTSARVPGWGWK